MDRVRCSQCGEEHDLSEMEPSFAYPDAYFEVPEEQRAKCITFAGGGAACTIRCAEEFAERHFLRALLPIPVRGEDDAFCWGVWVEVSESDFARSHEQSYGEELAFDATLANEIPGIAPSLGLAGELQLVEPSLLPPFLLTEESDHPLVDEQRDGVYPERVLEWLAPLLTAGHRA